MDGLLCSLAHPSCSAVSLFSFSEQINADDVIKVAFAIRLRQKELDDLEDEFKVSTAAA